MSTEVELPIDNPPCYLDRGAGTTRKYVFVSYSHANKQRIYDILRRLYGGGLNYWYDTELAVGDVWDERVEKWLRNGDCVGALLFVSINALQSDAILEEISIINDIREKNPSFFVAPILLGFNSYEEVLGYIIKKCNNPFGRLDAFNKCVSYGKTKYIIDNDATCDEIFHLGNSYGVCESNYIDVRGDKFRYLKNVTNSCGKYYLYAGNYPFSVNGDNAAVQWVLIGKDGNDLIWVTKYCLEFEEYPQDNAFRCEKEIISQIQNEEYFKEAGLISEELLEEFGNKIGDSIPTDYADRNRFQPLRVFWVKEKDKTGALCLYNSHNKKVNHGINLRNSKFNAGIRLVLVMDDSKIRLDKE